MPPPRTTRRTTSGDIAIGNLDGQIESLQKLLAAAEAEASEAAKPTATLTPTAKPAATLAPTAPTTDLAAALAGRRRQLIDLLSVRAELAGRIADMELAAELAETLAKQVPTADSHLTRAGARAALHRFDDAWADLEQAEKLGAPHAKTLSARASILFARGQLEEALALQEQVQSTRRDIQSTLVKAVILGDLDRRDDALRAFKEAFSTYEDTSPFPVARLFFQQGQFWERDGRRDLAIAYYAAALDRLPSYAHAAAHLARLSPPDKALPLLRRLIERSDDPELLGVLGDKTRESGDLKAAEPVVARAAARYEALVAREPAAFADHAAQFWLDTGNDPQKALSLAKINLETRKTPKAYELVVLSALSAGDRKTACETGTLGAALPRATSMFREIVKGACEPR